MLPTVCLGYCIIVYVTHCMSRLLYICLNSKYCNDPTKDSGNLHLVKRGEMRRKGRRAWLMGYKKGLGSQREGSLRRRKGGGFKYRIGNVFCLCLTFKVFKT